MSTRSKVRIQKQASDQFRYAGPKELDIFLDFIDSKSDYLTTNFERAGSADFEDFGRVIIVPYSEAGQYSSGQLRKSEQSKVVPFGTQNWIHIGNLACELTRPPEKHSEHEIVTMRQFFAARPDATEASFLEISSEIEASDYPQLLVSYLNKVRFNNA